MTDLASPSAPSRRPAVLIGYGDFGLQALQRLLSNAALRGVLTWRSPEGGASARERRLRDLATLWIPEDDQPQERQAKRAESGGGTHLEVMRDLYRQIQVVAGAASDPPPGSDLATLLERHADRLLAVPRRTAEAEDLPGLDVIVLARPVDSRTLGRLDRLLEPAMDTLASKPHLERGVQGAEQLAFIEILDFDGYWDPGAKAVRDSVFRSVEEWERRAGRGEPGFRRIYLCDRYSPQVPRDAHRRLDEISLFLELLLFESQQQDLQALYRASAGRQPLLGAFGVRLMERGTGLLSRLAAAKLGARWLDYLASEPPTGGRERTERVNNRPARVQSLLQAYRPEAFEPELGAARLRHRMQAEMRRLEAELLEISPENDRWPAQVEHRASAALTDIRSRLSEDAGVLLGEMALQHLEGFDVQLEEAITGDLHTGRRPASLAAVRQEIHRLTVLLEDASETLEREVEEEPLLEWMVPLRRIHERYREFRDQRVHADGLAEWWTVFTLVLTVGALPLVPGTIEDAAALLPVADPATAHHLALVAHRILIWLAHPAAVGFLLLLPAIFLVTRFGVHKPLVARTKRALRYFLDRDRGRFADRVRAALAPAGALFRETRNHLDGLLRDVALAVHSEILRELRLVDARLSDRRREMGWLRRQLEELRHVHGISLTDSRSRSPSSATSSTVRHLVATVDDLEELQAREPPVEERLRSLQAELEPFSGWNERHCGAFLYPLDFIERLSKRYEDPFHRELARPEVGPAQEAWSREFLDFLHQHRRDFEVGFSFKRQEGLPPEQRWCVLPRLWRRLPEIRPSLGDEMAISDSHILDGTDPTRAYLLQVQLGIDKRCLLTGREKEVS